MNGDKAGPAFHHGFESLGPRSLQCSFGTRIGVKDKGIRTLGYFLILRPLIGNDSLDPHRLPKTFCKQFAGRQINVSLGRMIRFVTDQQNRFRPCKYRGIEDEEEKR